MTSEAAWITAIRPRTLGAGFVPVAVGTGLAHSHGVAHPWAAGAAAVGALAIQVGTNLFNDYYDFVRGADAADRLGPTRATQAGLLSPAQVLRGGGAAFGVALAAGLYLASVGGWPIIAIGLVSLAAGYAYTGGPFPLGYRGLGDFLVLVFFGLIAVGGTYYVQAGRLTPEAGWAGLSVGALGTALLVVNNVRDLATDARAGKRTLAVRLGSRWARVEYFVLLALAYFGVVALWWSARANPWLLLPLASLPLAGAPAYRMASAEGAELNLALGETARLQLVFGLLWVLGFVGGGA